MYPWGALQNCPVPLLDPSRTHMASKEDVAKPFSSPQGQRRQEGLAWDYSAFSLKTMRA